MPIEYTIKNIHTMEPTCGVYGLIGPDRHIYVGHGRSILSRWNDHFKRLRKNYHWLPKLQEVFNEFGKEVFVLRILELTDPDDLIETEQKWITMFRKRKGWTLYNQREVAVGSMPGRSDLTPEGIAAIAASSSRTHKGRDTPLEWREALSVGCKAGGKMGRVQSMEMRVQKSEKLKGRTKSLETRAKMRLAQQERRTKEKSFLC